MLGYPYDHSRGFAVARLNMAQRALLFLPDLWELATSNLCVSGEQLRRAFEELTDVRADRSTIRRCRRQLAHIATMLEEQRVALEAIRGVAPSKKTEKEPSATASVHRHLYDAAVIRGEIVAASPWFDRYRNDVVAHSLGLTLQDQAVKKWRGPINRLR
jgi:hypothetical protein